MQAFVLISLIGLLSKGFTAPVDDGARGHRDSTKAILNLEQQLKQQAGEDKKYFSNDMGIPAGDDADNQALAQLVADGAAQEQPEQQDQATLDELAALSEGSDGLTLEQMQALQQEPVSDLDAEQLEALHVPDVPPEVSEQEPEDDPEEPELGTLSEDPALQSDKKSPYKVVAVSEKRPSEPAMPPAEPLEEGEDDVFMENLLAVLQKYPEFMDLMNDPSALKEYEEMVRQEAEFDREEAIKAEILAAQNQPEAEGSLPQGLPYGGDLSDYPVVEGNAASYSTNPEVEQIYPGDSMAREVAKKRGYETPPEYLEWLGAQNAAAAQVPVETRAAEAPVEQEGNSDDLDSYMLQQSAMMAM